MPVSPPTVGLSAGSLGDIIAVLQLAWDLRAALNEVAGASAELRTLVGDVEAFTRTLENVQANIERRRSSLRPDVDNGIAAALSRCRDVLSTIQRRIERAQAQTSSSGWQKYWGTAAWSILGGKKDVDALRARLSEQLGIIQLYLSLSESNCQERVQEVIEAQGTTLQRIYSVVQDIQLRFDVGVPGFHFYDPDTERYYPPLARTSFQRLRDVCEALRFPDDELGTDYNWIPGEDFNNLSVTSTQAILPLNFGDYTAYFHVPVEGYFFREAAFGEWQVLVGSSHTGPSSDRILKTLLERNHTVGADCNCPVACSTRYQDDLNVMIRRTERATAYSEVVSLIFEHLQPTELEPGWLNSFMMAFLDCPDPEHLRSTVPTVLAQQCLTPGEMVDLISKTPKDPKPGHSLGWGYKPHAVGFDADGATLVQSLVGHVLPLSEQSLSQQVRVPDWAHISDMCLIMNSNEKCHCLECEPPVCHCPECEQHRIALEANLPETGEM